jgi:hypothetical protein
MRLEHTSIRKKMGKLPETNYCIGRCTRADIKSNTNSGRFTVIGLTVALGDPIMGIVIFAGEELTFKQRMRQGSMIKAVSETTVDPAKHFQGPRMLFPWKTRTGFNCLQPKRIDYLQNSTRGFPTPGCSWYIQERTRGTNSLGAF